MHDSDIALAPDWWRVQATARSAADPIAIQVGGASRQGHLSYLALMLFTMILLLAPQQWLPMLVPLRIALLAAAAAVLSHVGGRFMSGKPVVELTPPLWTVLALTGWTVATIPFSVWAGGSVEYLMDVWFKTLIVFVLLANVINSLARLRGISWVLVLLAIPLALTTLANFLSGATYESSSRVVGYSAGLTENPNDMALMLNLILPFAVALFLASRSTMQRIFLGALVIMLAAAVLATFSRAGFLTLVVILLSYLWMLRRRKEWLWGPAMLLALACALPLMPAGYSDRISSIFNTEEDASGSAQTRLGDMKVALNIGLSNPLIGAGIGMNALAMNESRGATWTEIHNVYLQLWVELGLPGLLLFLLFCLYCFRSTSQVLQQGTERVVPVLLTSLAIAIRISMLAFAFAAFFHPVAWHFYFYYIAGLAAALPAVLREQQGTAVVPLPVSRR